MHLLPTPCVTVDKFHFQKADGHPDCLVDRFVIDASMLEDYLPAQGQVYADACDVGFTLVNPATNVHIRLVEDHEERTYDGDVAYWRFVPASPQEARKAKRKFEVIVFND